MPTRSTKTKPSNTLLDDSGAQVLPKATATGRPIRVGFVLTALQPGGLERFTLSLAARLPPELFECKVYTLLPDSPWATLFQEKGIPVQFFKAQNRPGIGAILPNFRSLAQLTLALRRDKIDILHTCDFFPATIGRVASLLAGVPARLHTLHSLYDWHPKLAHVVNRLLAKSTQCITGVSHSVLDSSRKLDGIAESKYKLVYNGVDEIRFQPRPQERPAALRRLGLPMDSTVIGCLGAFTERKGHRILVQAAIPLLQEDPKLHLVIAGQVPKSQEDDRNCLLTMAREAGVLKQLHLVPARERVEEMFPAFDLYCMASHVEGMSLAALEAQMSGCLSVYSDIGPFRELIRHGEDGFLFNRGDAADLRLVLRKALTLEPLLDLEIRSKARERALERFSLATMVDAYVRLYKQALLEHR